MLTFFQVISPYRETVWNWYSKYDFYKVSSINKEQNGNSSLMGILLFDKVIQVKNRTKSDQYLHTLTGKIKMQIFNGELGLHDHILLTIKYKDGETGKVVQLYVDGSPIQTNQVYN